MRRLRRLIAGILFSVLIFTSIGCAVPDMNLSSTARPTRTVDDTRGPMRTDEPQEDETTTSAPEPTDVILPTSGPAVTEEPAAEPTATPIPTATHVPEPTPTVAPTATPLPTNTPIPTATPVSTKAPVKKLNLSDIPAYSGKAYVSVFGDMPSFTEAERSEISFESYSSLDSLGRCGVAFANVGKDLMPKTERGEIGQVKPSGWHTVKYDCIEDLFLYNRCHLIAYCLTGENDNVKNLITGTRYMNVEGMLPFESKVANYVENTGNHVLYRVTPLYDGKNLVCNGVQIEALSVEDNGKGICFNIFCYNVQPDIVINYTTGDSYLEKTLEKDEVDGDDMSRGPSGNSEITYILNTNTKKIHYPSCSSVGDIKAKNRDEFTGDRQELIDKGYSPCKRCNP